VSLAHQIDCLPDASQKPQDGRWTPLGLFTLAAAPSQPTGRADAAPTPFEAYSAAPTATALAGALIATARKPAEIDERLRLVAAVSLLPEADRADLAAAAEAQAARRRAEPPRQRVLRRSRPRSPDRQASIERRRVHAGSGALPPWLRKRCTQGVAAAMTIIVDWRKGGRCELPIGRIAGLAGVCHTLAQDAMRLMRLGLGRVTERRQPGRANLTNSVEILDPDWLTWLELRRQGADLERVGFRNVNPAESFMIKGLRKPAVRPPEPVSAPEKPVAREKWTELRASLPP
jgi:hypothetical protein